MQYLANDPAMADCLTAVQNINADTSYPDACAKLYEVNSLNCSPADVIDVVITDPVYTPEEISELDCINAIYQLFYLSVYKSSSTYWLNADVKRCYSQIKGIIMKYFITPEPQRMDPCEFWEYLQQFLPCEPTPTIQEPVPTPTEPITYEPPVMTQPTPVHGFEPVQPSLDRVYYYHGDHLGSSTYVTDDNGRPVAYYDYLPFGEVAVEHNQTTNFNNGYKFNAKELDEATGMSYYGARYYDPRISLFVSVDPLVEKTMTPYQYVHQNPINLIDPTGMSADGWVQRKDGTIYWDENATSQATTKAGETYLGKTYEREKIWSNVNVRGNIENGLMRENYKSNGKMEYTNLTPWVDKAFEEMAKGISETGSNPEITKYWEYTQMPKAAANGDKWAQSVLKEDQTPWCAAFVNYSLETSGVDGTMFATAYSFKKYGQNLGNNKPVYGSIAVMNYSHVGFVVGTNKDGRIILLGGNQGNAINLSPNGKSSVIQYVYPSGHTPTNLSLPQYDLKGRSLTNATSR